MLTKLSVIIPVFNEENTIGKILDKIIQVKLIHDIKQEIIIINDCSKDKTKVNIENYIDLHQGKNIILYNQTKNQGKGAAIHKGISMATGEYLVVQDADLEYDPNEYNILLKPVVDGFADVVFGSRFMGGGAHRVLFFWHSIGNKIITLLVNVFSNLNLTDIETCYKLMKTEIIQKIKLKEKRFGFEPEVAIKLSRVPEIRIYEVGISYYGRTFKEGKKINWIDGFRAIYCILKYGIFRNL